MADKVLSYRAQLKDEASAAAAQIATNVAAADKATTGFGERLVSSGGRIREFRKAGLELANVASLIPGPWGDAATSVGRVLSMSGEIGLLSRAVVDLGGSALGFAGNALGMGAAATSAAAGMGLEGVAAAEASTAITAEGAAAAVAAGELTTLAAAEGAAAAASGGLIGKLLGLAAATGGAVVISRDQIDQGHALVQNWYDQRYGMVALSQAMDESARGIALVNQRYKENQAATLAAAEAARAEAGDQAKASAALVAAGQSANYLSGAVSQATQDQIYLRLASNATGAGLDNVGNRARVAAQGFDVLASSAQLAAQAEAAAVQQRLSAVQVHGPSGDIAGAGRGLPGFENLGQDSTLFIQNAQAHTAAVYAAQAAAAAAAKRHGGGGGGGGGGSSSASAALAAAQQAITDAYSAEKVAGDNAADELHRRNTQVITDAQQAARKKIEADHQATQIGIENAHKLADEQIQQARKAVDQALAAQKRLNAAPVTQAEAAQAAIEAGQQLRDLTATAQANPNDIHAQEALANFQAHQQIDNLRAAQALNDQAADDAATAAKTQLDAQQAAEDTTYQKHKDDEQSAYDRRVTAEEDRYKAKQATEDARLALTKKMFDDHVAALEKSKNASVGLAEIETRRYLQEQVSLARQALAAATTETEKAAAQGDLNNAQYDLTHGAPHHAAGGWVGLNGPELGWLGENGPEYVVPNGGAGGGGDVHMHGDIIVNGAGKSSTEIANEVLLAFKREVNRQRISMIPN